MFGVVRIPHVWVSIDSGTVVSPDRVRSQVEGAAIMATTQAMYGKVSFKKGRTVETNYDGYRMSRMSDSPREIHVDIVDSSAAPAGVGETGVPSFAPALCNAIFTIFTMQCIKNNVYFFLSYQIKIFVFRIKC